MQRQSCLLILPFLGVAIGLLAACSSEDDPDSVEETAVGEELCGTQAGERVADSLAAAYIAAELPEGSAPTFPAYGAEGTSVVASGECTFTVAAFVDVRTAAGETVRRPYTVTMTRQPDNSWPVQSLEIGD